MKDRKRALHFTVLLGLLCLFSVVMHPSAGAEAQEDVQPETIRITSDRLEADREAGVVVFTGNVVARQSEGTIMSKVLTVHYDGEGRMERIVARGDVRINQQDRVGTCQKATYYPADKRLVMEEDPSIWRGGDIVSGELITIFMDSDRMIVEGATATIYQERKDTRPESAGTDGR